MKATEHLSHGVPLEDYVLTKRDHRDQETSERIRAYVDKKVDEDVAELAAAPPEVRAGRQERFQQAWKIINEPVRDWDLMRWRVRLYCGHIREVIRHVTVESPVAHGGRISRCPECGRDPVDIVAYEPLGTVGQLPKPDPSAPRRASIKRRLAKIEAEAAQLRAELVEEETPESLQD